MKFVGEARLQPEFQPKCMKNTNAICKIDRILVGMATGFTFCCAI